MLMPVSSVATEVTHRGQKWERNFPRICPFCGVLFQAWAPSPWPTAPADHWTPNAEDRMLGLGTGHRETCGHHLCVEEATEEHAEWSKAEYERINAAKKLHESLSSAAQENERQAAGAERDRYA